MARPSLRTAEPTSYTPLGTGGPGRHCARGSRPPYLSTLSAGLRLRPSGCGRALQVSACFPALRPRRRTPVGNVLRVTSTDGSHLRSQPTTQTTTRSTSSHPLQHAFARRHRREAQERRSTPRPRRPTPAGDPGVQCSAQEGAVTAGGRHLAVDDKLAAERGFTAVHTPRTRRTERRPIVQNALRSTLCDAARG